MRVLVACESSGTVRDAFIAAGHDAVSCDIKPTERPGPHVQGDVTHLLRQSWDLVIAHPPCTYLCNSGNLHLKEQDFDRKRSMGLPGIQPRWEARECEMRRAVHFFRLCLQANAPRVAIENPIPMGVALTLIGTSYTQIINPWQFGHVETKATCLWLRGLPDLVATEIVPEDQRDSLWFQRTDGNGQGADRQTERSRTFDGIAKAMAEQWGACA